MTNEIFVFVFFQALNDNKWHTVSVARPSQKRHTLLIDEEFLAQAEVKVPKYQHSSGGLAGLVHIENEEDLHLDLDGILFLGESCFLQYLYKCFVERFFLHTLFHPS